MRSRSRWCRWCSAAAGVCSTTCASRRRGFESRRWWRVRTRRTCAMCVSERAQAEESGRDALVPCARVRRLAYTPSQGPGAQGMKNRHAMHAIACTIVFVLAGCSSGTPTARINAALPPGSEVIAAKAKLSAFQQEAKLDAAAFEAAYAQRLDKRVTECARGYTPSFFDDEADILERLVDKDCFARADAAIADWLRFRLVGE